MDLFHLHPEVWTPETGACGIGFVTATCIKKMIYNYLCVAQICKQYLGLLASVMQAQRWVCLKMFAR